MARLSKRSVSEQASRRLWSSTDGAYDKLESRLCASGQASARGGGFPARPSYPKPMILLGFNL